MPFSATPFSGEVNLLTTSAVRDGSILPLDFIPRGVAYMTIGAPAGYTLDGYGGLHRFGGAPAITNAPYWGRDIAVGLYGA